jgi:Methyltransferase FkbM domain
VTGRDTNLRVAVSDVEEGPISLHVIGDTGLTTTVSQVAEQSNRLFETIDVPTMSLNAICAKYATGDIDFLKIDVEGAEGKIVQTFDLQKYRPRVIVLENSCCDVYQPILQANRYIYTWFDTLDRWFVREEDEFRCDLIARPPSVWDSFTIERG